MTRSVKDKILLYKIRSGQDKEAFTELYDAYVEPIYRFVYFKISSKEEAEDVTSDVFLRAWNYANDPKAEISNFRGLLYTIARNCVIDVYRDRAKRQECSIEAAAEIASSNDIESELMASESVDQILYTMKQLKQEYQDVIHLRHIEGLSIREIAQVIDKSYASVRVTLHRAMKKLKELSEGDTE